MVWKPRNILFAIGLASVLLSCITASPGYALIEAPHNRETIGTCGNCHGSQLADSPFWSQTPDYNTFCWTRCHNSLSDRIVKGPAAKTHSSVTTDSSRGSWGFQCIACHYAHGQQQNNWTSRNRNAGNLYLARGYLSGPPIFDGSVTTFGIASITYKNANWNPASLKQKTVLNRGALFIPNEYYPSYNYAIYDMAADGSTVSFWGDLRGAVWVPHIAFYPFRVIYGQFVKEKIDVSGTPGNPGDDQPVDFFDPNAGTGGLVDTSGADPARGVCQVCHSQTNYWRQDGTLADHNPASNCTSLCHLHDYGFSHYKNANDRCIECHGHDTGAEYAPGLNSNGYGSSTSHSAHTEHDGDDSNGPHVDCDSCHDTGNFPFFKSGTDLNGDGRYTLNETDACDACHQDGTGVATGSPVVVAAPAWKTDIDCSGCHGFGPSYGNGLPKANSHPAHSGYSCEKCHAGTTADGSNIADIGLHLNSIYNLAAGSGVTFSYAYNAGGGTCSNISCHSNSSATWGQSACTGCHAAAIGSRAAITGQFSSNSHHVQAGSMTGSRCYVCHWEARSDGMLNAAYHGGVGASGAAVNLVIWSGEESPGVDVNPTLGSRPVAYDADGLNNNDTAIAYTASNLAGGLAAERAEVAKITPHCLGCHSDKNNDSQPFGDGKKPRAYAWDNTSVGARYSQGGSVAWGKYSSTTYPNATPKDKRTKAYSAHGNAVANQGGWDLNETWSNTRNGANYNVQCFDCHNSHGSTVAGITTTYDSATTAGNNDGGILKDTTGGGSGYAVSYQPVVGGNNDDKNVRNPGASLCFDCHLTQNGGAGKPWGYQGTFEDSQAIIGYYDSALLAPGQTGSQQRYPYKGLTTNAGGHFGHSTAVTDDNPTGDMRTTPVREIGGLCTPCHDPHGVSPTLGSNQQYGVPLLKGTWITSPYKEDAAPASSTEYRQDGTYVGSTPGFHIDQNTFASWNFASTAGINQDATVFGGLCLQCHAKAAIDPDTDATWGSMDRVHETVKGWGAGNKHKFSCSKCHTPHNGSALPRLMVTNCLGSNHRGRVGAGGVPGNHAGSGSDCGSGNGAGKFPGGGFGQGDDCEVGYVSFTYGFGGVACHDTVNSGVSWPANQAWNEVTPWEFIQITSGPAAGAFTSVGSDVRATITWSTNAASTSYVDYGITDAYGQSNGNATLVTSHVIQLTGLINHSTYHYRVRSGNTMETASADYTFAISVPPTVPTVVDEPNATCGASCGVTLQWNAASDPDSGPVQYQVEVDTSNAFNTGNKQTSAWISAPTTNWTPTLATNTTWYFRVKSRDGDHVEAISSWSLLDSFMVSDGVAPSQVVLSSPASGTPVSGCEGSASLGLAWTSKPPLADYQVQIALNSSFSPVYADSGWIAGSSWAVNVASVPSQTYYWQVRARDSVSGATGPWSAYWTVNVSDIGVCPKDSCPFIFTWNGSGYEYVTDIQGPVIGLPQATPAARSVGLFRPSSVVLNTLVPENGRYQIKLRETLKEITYLDEVKLLVVDHPAGYELVSSTAENTYSYDYVNPEQIYTIHAPRLPVSALATNGDDILASISSVDNVYAPLDYDSLEYITLDFGAIADPANAKLVIDGWAYYNASLRISDPVQPYVEVLDPGGNWVKVLSFGEPAGDLKRMVVPLSNVFQNIDQRVRLHLGRKSGGRWRLDRVMLDESIPVPVTVQEVSAASSDLYHAGMVPHNPTSLESRIFAEDGSLPDLPAGYGYGSFTRYGDVLPLLAASDDKFVIMRHADAVDLEFPEVEPPASGLERSYLLKVDLYYKSFRVENNVEPLPFHGMSIYPPASGENYPEDPEHVQYLETYNTRDYSELNP